MGDITSQSCTVINNGYSLDQSVRTVARCCEVIDTSNIYTYGDLGMLYIILYILRLYSRLMFFRLYSG